MFRAENRQKVSNSTKDTVHALDVSFFYIRFLVKS
jgi:hypothetical protein